MIENFAVLGSLVRDTHHALSQIFYQMLGPAIALSVALGYFKSGDVNFPDVLKRALVASILLVSFPEVSGAILAVCDGIAARIDDMSGLDAVMKMAGEKMHGYAHARSVLLLQFDDLFMAILSFLSFIIVYVARYLSVALYYFYWILLSICSPLMILCYIFPATANVTRNLYRGLVEVACWKILWAIQSAMLTSLAFGKTYQAEGSYLTPIVLNFVISLGLVFTPLIVRSLIGEGVQGSAQMLGAAAVGAAVSVPGRLVMAREGTRHALATTQRFTLERARSVRNNLSQRSRPWK